MHPCIRFGSFLILLFTLLTRDVVTLAQTTGGRILGSVTDPSGAVIARVKVKLINEQTGVILPPRPTRRVTTSSSR